MPWTYSDGLSISELAYAAGIFDGEGTVTIRMRAGGRCTGKTYQQRKKYHDVTVAISSTDEVLILWLQERWPGSLSVHRYQHDQYKQLFRWSIEAAKAELFLRDIRDYTLIKTTRIDLALEFRSTYSDSKRGIATPTNIVEKREEYRQRMLILNKRGVS